MMNADQFSEMQAAVAALHHKHDFRGRGGEDMPYRITLMAEELGEIAACVSKGKPQPELAEECADLLILLIGTAIAGDFDLNEAFWTKMGALEHRGSTLVDGRVRMTKEPS